MSVRDYDAKVAALNASELQLLTLEDFLTPPERAAYLVENLIPADAIVVVFGPAKSGKTFSVCDLMMHAAHGMHWHGHNVSKALRVVFLAGEGRTGLKLRLKAWTEWHASELRGDFRILPESLSLPERMRDVLECLRPVQPDVVVVDTLNAYFGRGDENATQDMTAFVGAVRSLRDTLRCTVIVVHHTGHAEVVRERGSSVLRAAADVIVHVARDGAGSGLIAFQVVDARDIEAWDSPVSLSLTQVESEWKDASGGALTTCVVEAGNRPVSLPGRQARPMGEAQSTLLAVAQELARGRDASPSGEVVLSRSEVNSVAQAKGISRQSASSAWKSLASRGSIRLLEPALVALQVERRETASVPSEDIGTSDVRTGQTSPKCPKCPNRTTRTDGMSPDGLAVGTPGETMRA